MYKITFLPDAEDSFKKLDNPVQKRIAQKIDWLAENADKIYIIHLNLCQTTFVVFAESELEIIVP